MIAETQIKNVLGVVGGLGPLASAEFLKTIYEHHLSRTEQESPTVIMYSDPTFPDRTDAFLAGNSDPLLAQLNDALECLLTAGATSIVICCMTIHYLLPRLLPHLRDRVISLLDIIFADIARNRKRYLLICSSGTRELGMFQNHRQWPHFEPYIVLPDEQDQKRIHRDLIYPIKNNPDIRTLFPLLEQLLEQYEVDSFIAGCSEVHLLAKHAQSSNRHSPAHHCIDPLDILAREWSQNRYEVRSY